MSARASTLFRPEVLRDQAGRLHGNVSLAIPLGWQAIGALLLCSLGIATWFLFTASYARVEMAVGTVTLDKGVTTVIPSREGVITAVAVRERQRVRTGELLLHIRAEEDLVTGRTATDRIRAVVREQDSRLDYQSRMVFLAAEAEKARLAEQVAGLRNEIVSITGQIADQNRLIKTAAEQLTSVQQIAKSGFISRRDLEAREEVVIAHRQQLARLQQSLSSKRAGIAEAQRAMIQSDANARVQAASTQSDRATLSQQLAQADISQGYAIKSPITGVVTALTARLGQRASPQHELMLIVPADARPKVELYVPTAAIGFLSVGQEVRLAVDAFPYQQFGTVKGTIESISGSTVARPSASGVVPVYLVTAELRNPWIGAYGKQRELLPGMTLTARIVTEKRSLFEWLFQPLFAIQGR